MRISITSPNTRLNDVLRRDAEQRLNVILGRMSNHIDHVSILLTDDNGLRGGVDKHCRVKVMVRGLGTVTAVGRHENVLASVDKALRRARRIIIQRRNRRVARSRKQHSGYTESDIGVNVTLVNTLAAESFERTRIPGAVNLPLEEDEFVARVEALAGGKDRPVVVYCASRECDSSERAAAKLEEAGFTDVLDFAGGAAAWKNDTEDATYCEVTEAWH